LFVNTKEIFNNNNNKIVKDYKNKIIQATTKFVNHKTIGPIFNYEKVHRDILVMALFF